MKKMIFMLMVTAISAFTISACTEENVQPTANTGDAGGGAGSTGPICTCTPCSCKPQ